MNIGLMESPQEGIEAIGAALSFCLASIAGRYLTSATLKRESFAAIHALSTQVEGAGRGLRRGAW